MGGTPDEGRLDLVGDDMFEVGIHAPYLEHWVRVATVGRGDRAIRFADPENGIQSLLIEIGSFAFCARPNPDGGGSFVFATSPLGPAGQAPFHGIPLMPQIKEPLA